MQHHKQPYYVALLSAAALYVAAHQQPQIFQVMTNKSLRSTKVGRTKIEFIVKKDIEKSIITKKQTETGFMNVATPETTAFDLVRYVDRVGSLNSIATILTELSEAIDSKKLVGVAQNEKLINVQRLGYLLEKYGVKKITEPLLVWFAKQQVRFVPLRTDKDYRHSAKNKNWKILINEKIEVDDI
jgi:predicted transcriptional regulator of viral defense system